MDTIALLINFIQRGSSFVQRELIRHSVQMTCVTRRIGPDPPATQTIIKHYNYNYKSVSRGF